MRGRGYMAYEATVEEVRSGDDLVLFVSLGIDDLYKRVRARLHGADTPDAYKAGPETEAGSLRDEVRRLTRGRVRIELLKAGNGGWVVTLYYTNDNREWVNLNQELISRGYVFKEKVTEPA